MENSHQKDTESTTHNIWNLPNTLSLLRIGVAPILILLLLKPGKVLSIIAALLFVVASVTDIVDGYIARKWGIVTTLGKFLDPLADKLLIMTALIMLVPLGRAPAWIVALIVGREIAVTGLRAVAADAGIVIAAGTSGKYKTILQAIAVTALLLHYHLYGINTHAVGMVILWIALAVTLWSGIEYFILFIRGEGAR
ncbi:MAG: CDP-diacylglycerol--glycerol-3-phosphate 3-phosphatidyltransferase [Thermodesulfobacteriota bacterium]